MRIFFLLLCLWSLLPGFGQDMELGLIVGGATYEGEIAPAEVMDYFQTYRPALGVFGRYHFSRHIALRADLRFATLFGDDAISDRGRNFNFRTRIAELTLLGEWTLFSLNLARGTTLSPYVHAGGGFLYFNPQGQRNNEYFDLQPLGTEGQGLPGFPEPYSPFTYVLTGGGGIKFNINNRWTLGIEGALRYSGTDYLDDVSTNPVTYREVLDGNGSLAAHFSRPNFDLDTDNPDATYVRGGEATDYLFMAVVTISTPLSGRSGSRTRGRYQMGCPGNF